MKDNLTFEQLPIAVSLLTKKLENIERLLLAKDTQLPTETPDQLLTVKEAAEFLNLAVPTIYTMVSRHEIPVMKRSKRLYFLKRELIEYLKAGRKKTTIECAAEAETHLQGKKKGGCHA